MPCVNSVGHFLYPFLASLFSLYPCIGFCTSNTFFYSIAPTHITTLRWKASTPLRSHFTYKGSMILYLFLFYSVPTGITVLRWKASIYTYKHSSSSLAPTCRKICSIRLQRTLVIRVYSLESFYSTQVTFYV